MAEERSGKVLERIVRDLERGGFEIGGDQLKTSPRGYDKDHPRIDLLRHKSLLGMKKYGFEPFVHTRRAARPRAPGLAQAPAPGELDGRAARAR